MRMKTLFFVIFFLILNAVNMPAQMDTIKTTEKTKKNKNYFSVFKDENENDSLSILISNRLKENHLSTFSKDTSGSFLSVEGGFLHVTNGQPKKLAAYIGSISFGIPIGNSYYLIPKYVIMNTISRANGDHRESANEYLFLFGRNYKYTKIHLLYCLGLGVYKEPQIWDPEFNLEIASKYPLSRQIALSANFRTVLLSYHQAPFRLKYLCLGIILGHF